MLNIDQIRCLATKFRTAMEKTTFSDPELKSFPRGACGPTTILLSQFLMEHGIKGMTYYCGLHLLIKENKTQSHAWIDLDGLIIDITGDQFKDKAEYGFFDIPVYVGQMDQFHSLFHEMQTHPLRGYMDYDESTKARYSIEYKKVLYTMATLNKEKESEG